MSKVLYTHATLTETSRAELLQWWQTNIGHVMPDKIGHHMTIKFKPNDEEVINSPLGKTVSLRVAGWGQNDKVQAVYIFTSVACANPIAHVTVAIDKANGGKPKDSNEMLINNINVVDGPKLEAVVEATLKNGQVIRELA